MKSKKSFVIGITGSSGIIYAIHFIKSLAIHIEGKSYIILSDSAIEVLKKEMDIHIQKESDFISLCLQNISSRIKHTFEIENNQKISSKLASGSFLHDGMVIIPCSMKTLSGIAHGYSSNLIERTAEVCLKERRKLILIPRETPLNLIHIENMRMITMAGGIILPANPGFYHNPRTIEDLLNFITGKIWNLLGIEQKLFPYWKG